MALQERGYRDRLSDVQCATAAPNAPECAAGILNENEKLMHEISSLAERLSNGIAGPIPNEANEALACPPMSDLLSQLSQQRRQLRSICNDLARAVGALGG